MALDCVDALSDDDAVAAGTNATPSTTSRGAKAETLPKAKAKPQGKGKAKASPKKKVRKDKVTKAMKKPTPKAAPKTLKRPASASQGSKPGPKRNPDHISTSKSQYKNGVYCIKLFGKQVITVAKLH